MSRREMIGKCIVVDYESEKSLAWVNGTIVYCRDTKEMYVLVDNKWINIKTK